MEFDPDDVKRIAALARLELSDTELDGFTAQLGAVLDHVAALDGGDGDVDAPAEAPQPLRSDVPVHDPLRRPPPEFAPAWVDGFFAVPRLKAFDGTSDPDARDG